MYEEELHRYERKFISRVLKGYLPSEKIAEAFNTLWYDVTSVLEDNSSE